MPGDPLIYVIGDALLDRHRFVSYFRQSPEDPACPVGIGEQSEWALGGAANVAHWLAGLGRIGRVSLIAHYSRTDPHAAVLAEYLKASGITQYVHLQRREGWGTVKERVYLNGEKGTAIGAWRQVIRIDRETNITLSEQEARNFEVDLGGSCGVQQPAAIVVADYSKGVFLEPFGEQLLAGLERVANARQIPIFVNSKTPSRWRRFGADVLIANEVEMRTLQGEPTAARHVVTTCAARGVTAHVNSGPWAAQQVHAPTQARAVRDVTGAGDAFLAGLSRHLVHVGFPRGGVLTAPALRAAIDAGQAAAADCCGQVGCGSPSAGASK